MRYRSKKQKYIVLFSSLSNIAMASVSAIFVVEKLSPLKSMLPINEFKNLMPAASPKSATIRKSYLSRAVMCVEKRTFRLPIRSKILSFDFIVESKELAEAVSEANHALPCMCFQVSVSEICFQASIGRSVSST